MEDINEVEDLKDLTNVDLEETKIVSDNYDYVEDEHFDEISYDTSEDTLPTYELIDEEDNLLTDYELVDDVNISTIDYELVDDNSVDEMYSTELLNNVNIIDIVDDVDDLLNDYDLVDAVVIDDLSTKIIPETPKTVSNEQLYIYVNSASNTIKGIIQGTYKPNLLLTTDLKVMVDVQLGKIKNIYVKRDNKGEITEERLDEYLQKLQNYINGIIDGTIVVNKAFSDDVGSEFKTNYLKATPQNFTEEQKAIMRNNLQVGFSVSTTVLVDGKVQTSLLFNSDPQEQINSLKDKIPLKTSSLENDGDGNSPFATEQYVEENGGKIDSISLNGNVQEIDANKNVNLTVTTESIGAATEQDVDNIKKVIPNQASETNQLADKDFVNSSIETATATFRGTYKDLDTLKQILADKNDYAFYDYTDELGNRVFDRYKHNGIDWLYEYSLNNSSFTDAQWKAINSGATVELINKILANEEHIEDLQGYVSQNTQKLTRALLIPMSAPNSVKVVGVDETNTQILLDAEELGGGTKIIWEEWE